MMILSVKEISVYMHVVEAGEYHSHRRLETNIFR